MNPTLPQLSAHLTLVQECFPQSTCIIAGGAVRDVLNRKPVKDIDVFIDLAEDPGPPVEVLADRLYCTGASWPKWHAEPGYLGYGGKLKKGAKGAFLVCDIPKGVGGCHTQLIFLNCDPVDNIHATFDFDLSQAWVTRHRVWTSALCRRAMIEKMITYCPRDKPTEQQKRSSRERLIRLKEKYAGWHFRGII